ncbi:MAG TPA: DinB family protein [Anaerolineaceae bacterium]
MDQDVLLALTAYHAYANRLLFSRAQLLDEAQFTHESRLSHGSVQRMLRHILGVERGFLAMAQGQKAARLELTSFSEIRAALEAEDAALQAFVQGHAWEELCREAHFDLGQIQLTLPVWKALLQILVHSIHHRGELSILMTELGQPLPTPDIIVQFAEEGGQPWPWM